MPATPAEGAGATSQQPSDGPESLNPWTLRAGAPRYSLPAASSPTRWSPSFVRNGAPGIRRVRSPSLYSECPEQPDAPRLLKDVRSRGHPGLPTEPVQYRPRLWAPAAEQEAPVFCRPGKASRPAAAGGCLAHKLSKPNNNFAQQLSLNSLEAGRKGSACFVSSGRAVGRSAIDGSSRSARP